MRLTHTLPLALTLLALPALAAAQAPSAPRIRIKASRRLLAQAAISGDSAATIALTRVPGGTIREAELENEHHRLIYSFDIKVAGKPGITEVNVDAKTGAVVDVSHEGPTDQPKDKRAAKKDSTSGT